MLVLVALVWVWLRLFACGCACLGVFLVAIVNFGAAVTVVNVDAGLVTNNDFVSIAVYRHNCRRMRQALRRLSRWQGNSRRLWRNMLCNGISPKDCP